VLIKRIHAIPDLGEATCSALIACKSATTDGHAYQLRILDYGADFGLEKRPMITVYHSHAALRTRRHRRRLDRLHRPDFRHE